jgi:recombination protein RecR
MTPDALQRFIERFSRLPSLGPRLATRLGFFLAGHDAAFIEELAASVKALATLERCPRCFFFKQAGAAMCSICANPERDRMTIAIIEKETDLISIEKTGKYAGTYFLLGELPERGVLTEVERERIACLARLIDTELGGKAAEIIVAVSQDTFGDFATEALKHELGGRAKRITRLGRGIPTGGAIEFADEETLGSALTRRSE